MYTISALMQSYLDLPGREFEAKVVIGATTYDKGAIITFSVGDAIIPNDCFVIGAVVASSLSLELKTADAISENSKVVPYIRMNGSGGFTEWVPLGEFFIDKITMKSSTPFKVYIIKCYDALIKTNQDYVSALTYPTTMTAVLDECCALLGVTKHASLVLNAYSVESAPSGLQLRDALSYIASAHGNSFRLDKDGKLRFAITSNIYTLDKFTTAAKTNENKVYTKFTCDILDTVISSGAGAPEAELKFVNPWIDQTILDVVAAALTGFEYVPFNLTWRYRPDVEVGDWIVFTLRDGTEITAPILTNTLTYFGGAKAVSTAPSTSTQDVNFGYLGAVDRRITKAETSIIYNASQIDLKASQESVDALVEDTGNLLKRIEDAELLITPSKILAAVKLESGMESGDTLSTRGYVETTADGAKIAAEKQIRSEYGEVILNVQTYFDFSVDGLRISESTSGFSVLLDSSELGFYDGSTRTAYVNAGEFNIEKGVIKQSLTIGVHKVEKYNDTLTIFRYVGVM